MCNGTGTAISSSVQIGDKNLAFLILPSKVPRGLLVWNQGAHWIYIQREKWCPLTYREEIREEVPLPPPEEKSLDSERTELCRGEAAAPHRKNVTYTVEPVGLPS